MKKVLLFTVFIIIALGIMFNAGHVFADNDGDNDGNSRRDNSGSNSGSNSNSNSESGNSGSSDNLENNNRENEENENQESRKADGMQEFANESERENRTNNERETKNRTIITFVDENGQNISIRVDIKTKIRGNQTIERIKVKEIEAESDVEIENETEHKDGKNITHFRARLSNGNKEEIKVMPDRASERAIEVLQSRNLTIVLREVGKGNDSRIVYFVNGSRTVKLIGLFKINANLVAVINPTTGNVEQIQKPWWFFLVFGSEAIINVPGNQSVDNSTITNSTAENFTNQNETVGVGVGVSINISNSS